MNKRINNFDLYEWLEEHLKLEQEINDYCPNGLQVEGNNIIKKIVSGVTINKELIEIAIKEKANAIIVHHGLFSYKEQPIIIGMKLKRLELILKNKINIFAYHLPLDMHPIFGNNIQFAKKMDFVPFLKDNKEHLSFKNGLILMGTAPGINNLNDLFNLLEIKLNRKPFLIGDPNKKIKNITWCTGAGQKMFEEAINIGADVYITGEISEANFHIAKENDVGFISAGHHATERYGIKFLSEYINKELGIETKFIDIDNPI